MTWLPPAYRLAGGDVAGGGDVGLPVRDHLVKPRILEVDDVHLLAHGGEPVGIHIDRVLARAGIAAGAVERQVRGREGGDDDVLVLLFLLRFLAGLGRLGRGLHGVDVARRIDADRAGGDGRGVERVAEGLSRYTPSSAYPSSAAIVILPPASIEKAVVLAAHAAAMRHGDVHFTARGDGGVHAVRRRLRVRKRLPRRVRRPPALARSAAAPRPRPGTRRAACLDLGDLLLHAGKAVVQLLQLAFRRSSAAVAGVCASSTAFCALSSSRSAAARPAPAQAA